MKKTIKKQGFTLVEMSIILVIIGLIVGGVLTGKSLIETSRIKSQISQLQQFETAYNTFVNTYDAIPGDMNNADAYWPGTAIGNGNRMLDGWADNAYQNNTEGMKFFIHLSQAKLLAANYDGTYNLGTGYPELEIRKGTGLLAANGISPADYNNQLSAAEYTKRHISALYLNNARPDQYTGAHNDGKATMTVIQAYTIDKKLDDGNARTGRFQAHRATSLGGLRCLTTTDGDYFLGESSYVCMGAYILE